MILNNKKIFLIKKKSFYSFLIFVVGFIFSYLYKTHIDVKLFPDQIVYDDLYDRLKNKSFGQSYDIYRNTIASLEVFHFFYIFISLSLGLTKEMAMSLANAILVYFISKSIFKYFKPSFISLFFILANHYTLNLFFVLERFKFSIIFLFVILYFYKKKYISITAFFLSILSHFSILILYLIYLFNKLKFTLKKKKLPNIAILNKEQFFFFIVIIMLIFIYLLFEKHFQIKFQQAFQNFELKVYLINILKIFIFFISTAFVYNKFFKDFFYTCFYFILLEAFFSNTRIVFFSFLYFFYYVSISNNLTKRNFVLFIFFTYSCVTSLKLFFYPLLIN